MWWLPSRHLQTIWPSLLRPRHRFTPHWECLELDDGDFLELAWHPRPASPLVLVIHGLEGSLQSHYAGNLLEALHAGGFSSVLLHLRGCGRTPNRLPQSYHSGKTADLREVLSQLQQRGQLPDAVIGISLGGNLLLKYLGEEGADSPLQTAITISVPFQLAACARQLETGIARVYGRYLLSSLKASYRSKFSRMPSPLQVDLQTIHTLWQFDDAITAPLHGFAGAADYYARCSSAAFLAAIRTPTLILQAADDPFLPSTAIPAATDLSATVTMELTRHGGHVGFIGQLAGREPPPSPYWLEHRVIAHLQDSLLPEKR
ncbi:MAG: hydrolase [Thiolinea sp.]